MGASQTVLPFKLAAARRTSGKRRSSPRGRVVLAFRRGRRCVGWGKPL